MEGIDVTKKYIYIDESGDLGLSERSSRVLIISSLIADNPAQLDRIIKNARRHKFNKELKKAKEIKFNKSSPELREYLIKALNEINGCQAIHCIMHKGKLYSTYLKEHKDKLYNFVAGGLANNITLNADIVEIRVDKSKGKNFLRTDFNQYFEKKLRNSSVIGKINIFHSYSENFSGIQFADLLSDSAYQKFNNSDSHYMELIDNNKFPQYCIDLWKRKE